MAAANASTITHRPVVNDKFCSNLRSTFIVKNKSTVYSKVGSIVIEDTGGCQKFIFEESDLKESDGTPILTVELKNKKQCKAFSKGGSKHFFTLKYSGSKKSIEVFLTNSKLCDYEIETGSLKKDNFKIFNKTGGNHLLAAQVTLNLFRDDNEIIKIKSTYNVNVEPGYDQAFIFGLVAVLEQLRP